MIEELLRLARDPATEADLRVFVAEHVRNLMKPPGHGGRQLVGEAEEFVRADPERAFAFDSSGLASLTVSGTTWSAGRFDRLSLGDLRRQVDGGGGASRLFVFAGRSPVTDIGALQTTVGGRPLFQVASQFNCLESPAPRVVPVADYFSDSTQGPRAAISAFPATLLRHYAAPVGDGSRFVQETDRQQLDLLSHAFAPGRSPVRNGYLTGHGGLGGEAVAAALEEGFERIQVGVHDESQVVLGHDWDGAVQDSETRRIAQAFTSTATGGSSTSQGALGASFLPTCRQLLRAGYLGTLLAAISLRRSPVVLTLIGGGVFGNPLELIWESLVYAFDRVRFAGQRHIRRDRQFLGPAPRGAGSRRPRRCSPPRRRPAALRPRRTRRDRPLRVRQRVNGKRI